MKTTMKEGFEKLDIILEAETEEEERILKNIAGRLNISPWGPIVIEGSLNLPQGQIKLSIG
jgi:hypothetical protein